MSLVQQTLNQFLEMGEASKNFANWYLAKNAKSPKQCPLTMWSDEWFEELATYALDMAGWESPKPKLDPSKN